MLSDPKYFNMKPERKTQPDSSRVFEFTPRDYARVRALIYKQAGISLSESKQEMVYSRLSRRLRAKNLNSFEAYLDGLESGADSGEWEAFTNALTTNLTAFFREAHHFPILAEHVLKTQASISIWCSASSTGEEPYSIAMTVCEAFGTLTPPVNIVATDIDTHVLNTASNGVYPIDRIDKMAQDRVKRFFQRGTGSQAGLVRVRPELRNMITFKSLNLLAGAWPVSRSIRCDFLPQCHDLFRQANPEQDSVPVCAVDESGWPVVRRSFRELPVRVRCIHAARQDGV